MPAIKGSVYINIHYLQPARSNYRKLYNENIGGHRYTFTTCIRCPWSFDDIIMCCRASQIVGPIILLCNWKLNNHSLNSPASSTVRGAMQVTSLMRCEHFWLLNKECLNNLQKKGVCVLICGQQSLLQSILVQTTRLYGWGSEFVVCKILCGFSGTPCIIVFITVY